MSISITVNNIRNIKSANIELPFEKYCVSEVVFGPLQIDDKQKSHQVNVMEELLKSKEYSASVDYSKIPVRF